MTPIRHPTLLVWLGLLTALTFGPAMRAQANVYIGESRSFSDHVNDNLVVGYKNVGDFLKQVNGTSATLGMLTGSSAYFVYAYSGSTVNFIGAVKNNIMRTAASVDAYDSSSVNVAGGLVGNLAGHDQASIVYSGGTVGGVILSGSSTFSGTGGIVQDLYGSRTSMGQLAGTAVVNAIDLRDSASVSAVGSRIGQDVRVAGGAAFAATSSSVGRHLTVQGGAASFSDGEIGGDLSNTSGSVSLVTVSVGNDAVLRGGTTSLSSVTVTNSVAAIQGAEVTATASRFGSVTAVASRFTFVDLAVNGDVSVDGALFTGSGAKMKRLGVFSGATVRVEGFTIDEDATLIYAPDAKLSGGTIGGRLLYLGSLGGGLDRVTIGSDLSLTEGSAAMADRVRVGGNLIVGRDSSLQSNQGTVQGNLKLTSSRDVALMETSVAGHVEVTRARLSFKDGQIDGNVFVSDSSKADLSTRINGNLVAESSEVRLRGGSIHGAQHSISNGSYRQDAGDVIGQMRLAGTARADIRGGSVAGLVALGSSRAELDKGIVSIDAEVGDDAILTLRSLVGRNAIASGRGWLGLFAGTVVGGDVIASGDAVVVIEDALIDGRLLLTGNSEAYLSGGNVAGGTGGTGEPSGMSFASRSASFELADAVSLGLGFIVVSDRARITFVGPDLVVQRVGDTFDGAYSEYLLTGQFSGGDPVNGGTFYVANGTGASFRIVPAMAVPEPASLALSLCGGLLLLAWVRRRSASSPARGCRSPMRRTKATLIYRRTENLLAVQLLLGHRRLESTVRYLGIEVDDASEISEQTAI